MFGTMMNDQLLLSGLLEQAAARYADMEIVGQLLVRRLLDYATAGETDYRARFGEVEITEARKRCGHATSRRIT